MSNIVNAYLNGKDGFGKYVVDLKARTMYRANMMGMEGFRGEYRSNIEPCFVFLPLWLIAIIFFDANPLWAWGLKEIESPYTKRDREYREEMHKRHAATLQEYREYKDKLLARYK